MLRNKRAGLESAAGAESTCRKRATHLVHSASLSALLRRMEEDNGWLLLAAAAVLAVLSRSLSALGMINER